MRAKAMDKQVRAEVKKRVMEAVKTEPRTVEELLHEAGPVGEEARLVIEKMLQKGELVRKPVKRKITSYRWGLAKGPEKNPDRR